MRRRRTKRRKARKRTNDLDPLLLQEVGEEAKEGSEDALEEGGEEGVDAGRGEAEAELLGHKGRQPGGEEEENPGV